MGRWARSYPKLLDLDREIFQNLLALRHFSSMNRVGYGPCTALCESTGTSVLSSGMGPWTGFRPDMGWTECIGTERNFSTTSESAIPHKEPRWGKGLAQN
jgi:hypothetical protein